MSLVGAFASTTRSRCVVLVPVAGSIYPDCERALGALEARGYVVRRLYGQIIDFARSQMATAALDDGFDELMWIDSDVAFDPDDVDRLRAHGLPLVCGIYPKKGQRALACNVLPGTERLVFGETGGVVEIEYAATGFLLTHRRVYEDIRREQKLPVCNERFGQPVVPYFLPMVHEHEKGAWYLGEDFAFCERARRSGHRVFADTRIRLEHIGTYRYSWEDAGGQMPRYSRYDFHVKS